MGKREVGAQIMNHRNHITAFALLAAWLIVFSPFPPACAKTEAPTFDRYNVILEREPFGEISPSDVSVMPPEESFAKHLEMRAIIDYGDEIRVGFLDKKSKENIYLSVGENIDGIELVSVDYQNEEATLRKGQETSIFSLKKDKTESGKKLPGKTAAKIAQPVAPRRRRPFFSKIKKPNARILDRDGSTIPFSGKTIEAFLKEHPGIATQYPSPIRPSPPTLQAGDRGETIERFLLENPDAGRRFSPIQPPDPNVIAEGKGETIERFLREHSDQMRQVQPSIPIQFPTMEQPVEMYTE